MGVSITTLGVPGVLGGGGSILPLDLDFSTLPDGALPSPLVGATWAISSGAAVNTPTSGSNLLTDPGLEAAYTAGKCDTLTKGGSPTLLEETTDVHGGSKAQSFTATVFNDRVNWPVFALLANRWYSLTLWGKRTAGTGTDTRFECTQIGGTTESVDLSSATWEQVGLTYYSPGTGNLFTYAAKESGASGFDTVLVDDGSVNLLTTSSLFMGVDTGRADCVVKTQWTQDVKATLAAVARLDSFSTPTSYLLASVIPSFRRSGGYTHLRLDKFVSGVRTNLIDTIVSTVLAPTDVLEIRCSGTSVQLWFRNVQVGATQTVSDAEIVSNTIYGAFNAGGSQLESFFVTAN